MGRGEHKYGTAISAAGQYIPAAAPINDWPNRYKIEFFAMNNKKLAIILKNEEIIKQYQNANQLTAKELDEVEAEIARAEETYDAYVELVRTGTICMSRA